MGEYFCDICKFFDDDVSLLILSFYMVFFLYARLCFTFFVPESITPLLCLQISKEQFHCDDCGICRWVVSDIWLLVLHNNHIFVA